MKALTPGRLVLSLGTLLLVLLVCMALGVLFGSSTIDVRSALSEWMGSGMANREVSIVFDVRLPRVVMAALVGGALGSVGAVFQAMLKNPLADPYILGVSGGASVGVVLATSLGLLGTIAGASGMFVAAFAGALGAVAVIYGVASVLPQGVRGRYATYTLLLTGVVFNAFAMSFVLIVRIFMSPLDSQRVLFWLMGNLSVGGGFDPEFWFAGGCISVGVSFLVLQARKLNLLALGDDAALALGVQASRTRFVLFLAASLAVGAAVAAGGMIGFVGLIVPHSLRLLLGADNRLLVPASVLGGSAFLVLADLLSRLVFPLTRSTLPVGAVTAIVGVPLFFLFLIHHLRQSQASGIV